MEYYCPHKIYASYANTSCEGDEYFDDVEASRLYEIEAHNKVVTDGLPDIDGIEYDRTEYIDGLANDILESIFGIDKAELSAVIEKFKRDRCR